MKVLRSASRVYSWKDKFSCTRCESRLEVEFKDLVHLKRPLPMKSKKNQEYELLVLFGCPACRQSNVLSKEQVPTDVIAAVHDKFSR